MCVGGVVGGVVVLPDDGFVLPDDGVVLPDDDGLGVTALGVSFLKPKYIPTIAATKNINPTAPAIIFCF